MRRFSENSDVVFGDVDLSSDQIRGNHNPGQGGWPTVRYFNKDTGYEGAPYEKKTDKAICDELGNDDYMNEYIMEKGNVFLCEVSSQQGCSEKEAKFIDTWTQKTPDEVGTELSRLQNVKSTKLSPEQKEWFSQRIRALKQIHDQGSSKAEL